MKQLKILYHLPSLETIYAFRTIYNGYKNAFEDLGCRFVALTSNDNLKEVLKKEKPDIFITSSHHYYLKFLDLNLIKEYRNKGMVMFTKVDYWTSPINRLSEARSFKDEKKKIELVRNGMLGDIFFNFTGQDDKRMIGFKQGTGKKFETILLAADKTLMYNEYNPVFKADISFIGTNIPEKRGLFKEWLFPLKEKYKVRIYGQDWTLKNRILGLIQRFGQYFNIKFLKSIQKPALKVEDEHKIYSSSKICINLHDIHQIKYGDLNERLFKIPACHGFEITNYVPTISLYFRPNEMICAKNRKEWFDKIDYYMTHPEKRKQIAEKGYRKVMKYHTYHNRVKQIFELYKNFKKGKQ